MFHKKDKSLLVIVDDILPQNMSSFRNIETIEYLKHFDNVVYVNISLAPLNKKKIIEEIVDKKIKYFQTNLEDDEYTRLNAYLSLFDKKEAMITFLNNIYGLNGKVLDFLEKQKIKFSFTLYPGGGFFINDETTKKLKKIFKSPMFYKVVVTQKQTLNYLEKNNLCPKENVEFIYGLPIAETMLNLKRNDDKFMDNIINVCFVAYKYSKEGKDKGYDTFIEVAKSLKNDSKYRFHVVGNFDSNDIDVSEIKNKIKFYGILENEKFVDFYKDKDILITPTRANILYKGAFDGFPTGASIDAMLNQVIVLTSDPLDNNLYFENGKDLIIIDNDVKNITEKIKELVKDPVRCAEIGKNGQNKANILYSFKKQIKPRIKIIKEMSRL